MVRKSEAPSKLSELAEEIISAAPELKEIIEEGEALLQAPANGLGLPGHVQDEQRLQALAEKLAVTGYPASLQPKLIEFMDKVRLSLVTA